MLDTINVITSVCIFIIVLSLACVPIRINFNANLDVARNDGGFFVKIFGLKVLKDRLYFKHLGLLENDLIVENHGKKMQYHLNADPNDDKSIAKFLQIDFIPYVNVISVNFDCQVGKRDDALFTTFIVGGVQILISSILSRLVSSQHAYVYRRVTPDYNSDTIKLAIDARFDITIADIAYSFILYIKKKARKQKGGNNDFAARRTSD